ncbi:unnamed protein product [Effrenium voratum]|uniref:Uncharacterized protein n=1 Tax=Effrenium voratum TaxID=2562239 RepID=A0AA36N3V0_9DINO|nr:unnamed protein product [Effrenium voratum]
MQYAPQYAPQPVPQASSMVVSSSPYQTAGSTYTPYGAPAAAPSLDHTLGKWFAPGEALPPGFMAVPHPEGHIEPQAHHAMSEAVKAAKGWMANANDMASGMASDVADATKKVINRCTRHQRALVRCASKYTERTKDGWDCGSCEWNLYCCVASLICISDLQQVLRCDNFSQPEQCDGWGGMVQCLRKQGLVLRWDGQRDCRTCR